MRGLWSGSTGYGGTHPPNPGIDGGKGEHAAPTLPRFERTFRSVPQIGGQGVVLAVVLVGVADRVLFRQERCWFVHRDLATRSSADGARGDNGRNRASGASTDEDGAVSITEGGYTVRRITQDETKAVPDASPIMIGEVVRQNLVAAEDAALLRVTAITFRHGARNKRHRHEVDQVLVVTHGRGIVATDDEEQRVGPGDVVLIPAGERHWHGAEPGNDFTHLAILTPGSLTIEE